MIIQKLPTNFIDAETTQKLYEVTDTTDGQVLVADVSEYTEFGSYFGAKEINTQHQTVNDLIDNQNFNQGLLDGIMNGATVFDHVTTADFATDVTTATNADTCDTADSVSYAPKATTADLAEYADLADLADYVDYAPRADEAPEIDRVSTADTAQYAPSAIQATSITGANINGVAFNGTQNITVTDSTKFSKSSSFILQAKQALTFENKVCTILDSRIQSNSLAEVVFTRACLDKAKKAGITVDTSSGAVTITAGRTPTDTLYATIYIRVV